MEKKLKKLRQHMIDAKLHEMDFSEQSKRKVLENVKGSKIEKKHLNRSVWFKSGLSAVVCIVLLIGGVAFALNNSGEKPSHISSGQSHGNAASVKATSKKLKKQHYPPVKDPGPLTKSQIQYRMLNSPDYFTTAQGTYEYNKATVQYELLLKEGGQFRSYSQTSVSDIGLTNVQIVKGSHEIEISPHNRTYQKLKVQPYHKGDRPLSALIGASFNSITPIEEVKSFLFNDKKWKIVSQNARVAGQKAVEISGTSDRQTQRSFKFWISRATGILLKMKLYDSKGNVVDSLVTSKIQLNKPLDLNKFHIQVPKGYSDQRKKMMQEMKTDPRASKIKYLVSAKNGGSGSVQDVFQKVKAHVPFLYTFKGSDIFLDSAGLQKYEKYYQSTLAFIPNYQKNHVAKKGTEKFLFVREYNQNSFVRQKGGDFVTAKAFKKHTLKSYSLNGISWKGYTVMSQPHFPETYMKGTKGKYVYEVVGQDLSFKKVKACLKAFHKAS